MAQVLTIQLDLVAGWYYTNREQSPKPQKYCVYGLTCVPLPPVFHHSSKELNWTILGRRDMRFFFVPAGKWNPLTRGLRPLNTSNSASCQGRSRSTIFCLCCLGHYIWYAVSHLIACRELGNPAQVLHTKICDLFHSSIILQELTEL